jgi:hypothetical protein
MCGKLFKTIDYARFCSVGCNVDWAHDSASFDREVEMPNPCIILSDN